MTTHDVDVTVNSLAQRLDVIEHENHTLRGKIAALEGAAICSGATRERTTLQAHEQLSRRWLLRRGMQAAAAAVAAGILVHHDAQPAMANHLGPGISVNSVNTHYVFAEENSGFALYGKTTDAVSGALEAFNRGDGPGVLGISTGSGDLDSAIPTGVRGEGAIGVWGTTTKPGYQSVYGSQMQTGADAGYGVAGDAAGADTAGVLGRNATGRGVEGNGRIGVYGTSSTAGQAAVWGYHSGQGFGVVGDGAGATIAGVIGRNATGDAVRGEGKNGVHGTATSGYGRLFQGGKAQLRLLPKTTTGKPTTGMHAKGELLMDTTGTLFICTVTGTPGTWRKVSTVAA